MNIILVAINAKYIHSNLAIRDLQGYAYEKTGLPIRRMEFTINQHIDDIVRDIYKAKPDVLGISCYIWNYEMVKYLVPLLKQLLPDCLLFLGGPEVSYSAEEAIRDTGCDLVITGEGEKPFARLADALSKGSPYHNLPGIAFLEGESFCSNPPEAPVQLDELPFPYEDGIPENRIVYYECSRGCPFSCQYCLSSGSQGVRFRSLERVFADFDRFLADRVPQVKLVDRTFNCSKEYCNKIWRYLSSHDNGITNFHFEIAAELLDDETISFLNGVRPGLFQFEIGVQSTNPDTLAAAKRITLPEKLTPIVAKLQKGKNIHLHLDLIAGLPLESYSRFGESFNYVYSLRPDQIQLGFLKLLKGSGLRKDAIKYGIAYTPYAPYEVTATPSLSYREICSLKMIAQMVEIYYNSHRYDYEVSLLLSFFPDPFALFSSLAQFYEENGYHRTLHAKTEYYTILLKFLERISPKSSAQFSWLARHDIYSFEKAKKLPNWMGEGKKEEYRDQIYRFFDEPENIRNYLPEYAGLSTREILRHAHIEVFPFDPRTGKDGEAALLYNYRAPHFPSGASITSVNLPE